MYRAAIITVSDSAFAGRREDQSGSVIRELITAAGFAVVSTILLPDEREPLAETMQTICDTGGAELLLTTGGTGLSPRDITPEATMDVVERVVPGIAEAIRARSLQITERAMLSRAVSGIRKGTLLINLPGSPNAVRECLSYILPAMMHGLDILTGAVSDCARNKN